MATPATTRAIIVGVETYALGDDWNLPGPINDAVRFAEWLLANNVPAENIQLLLSPPALSTAGGDLVPTEVLPAPAPLTVRDARRPTIRQAFKDLRTNPPDLLYVYWGGHGFQHQREHHLLCQDAEPNDLQNINRINIAEWLRSDWFQTRLDHQIWFIDTCAKNTSRVDFSNEIPDEDFPIGGSTVESRRQQLVLSAARGQGAQNDSLQRCGIFSEALMKVLPKGRATTWPPDMDSLRDKILDQFDRLRASLGIVQHPEFHGDWGTVPRRRSSIERILQINIAPSLQPPLQAQGTSTTEAYLVTAHLWKGDNPEEIPGLDTRAFPRSELESPIHAAVAQAFRMMGRGSDITLTRLDFVLPATLLDTRFEQMVLGRSPAAVGQRWPVVVRSHERQFIDDGDAISAAQNAHSHWHNFAKGEVPPQIVWLPKPCETTFRSLLGTHPIVGALRLLPDGASSPSPLLPHLPWSDVPVAVWLHDHQGDEAVACGWIESHLTPDNFRKWPHLVHAVRTQALPAHPAPKPCSGLTLFWEDPEHFLRPNADLRPPDPIST